MKKIIRFWELNINPITGWKRPKSKSSSDLEEPEIKKGFQDSKFIPKGFR